MDIDVGQGLCCLATISSFFFPGHIALAADAPLRRAPMCRRRRLSATASAMHLVHAVDRPESPKTICS